VTLRAVVLVGLTGLTLACVDRPPVAPTEPPKARLVVLVVIDQLPLWAWPAKIEAAEDGLARIAAAGRTWRASYPFAATQTAPGHATLGTGAAPSAHGIIGNEWWHRELGREIRADEDPAGGPPSAGLLRVEGIAEALARQRPGARAAAVALKSRSGLLTLGKAGFTAWYDDACPCFVGSAPRRWLDELAAARPIEPRLAEPWTASDPARLEKLSGGPDDAPGELAIPGWDATFPHAPTDARSPAKAIIDTPLGNQIVVEAALAAVVGEGLGKDDVTDLLVVSFSAHDYVGHAFGADSWEAWDAWLRLDRQIGHLLRALDEAVGVGRWTLVLTGDHGAPPLPERRAARGEPGRRFSYDVVAGAAEAAAAKVAGEGDWIASARVPYLYLSAAALALPAEKRDAVVAAAVEAVRGVDGIARADRTADLTGGCEQRQGDDRAICLSIDPERSGEIFYAPGAGTVLHKADWVDAVAHGSLNGYDRDVPIVVIATGVAPGRDDAAASPLQVAPTLAALLGIEPPAAAAEPSLLP
jgi:hypothetical protein